MPDTLHHVSPSAAEQLRLGIVDVLVLADQADTQGAFGLMEFRGGAGPWTVLHQHADTQESFYVLDGRFTFSVGDRTVEAGRGDFLRVPRGRSHMMTAHEGGGALLTLVTPGGLEDMFRELARLPADGIQDPRVRREIADRFDSIPV